MALQEGKSGSSRSAKEDARSLGVSVSRSLGRTRSSQYGLTRTSAVYLLDLNLLESIMRISQLRTELQERQR